MRNIYKIMLGIFCGGVLLSGIGAGIAFGEFSSLSYGGEKILGETHMVEEDLDVSFEPGEEPWLIHVNMACENHRELIPDENIPENTVRFRVSYNEEILSPGVEVWEEGREIGLYGQWHAYDDVELMLEAKDAFLKDLKEGTISSYDRKIVEKVEVFVNPIHENDVQWVW